MNKIVDFSNPKWGMSSLGLGLFISKEELSKDDYFLLNQEDGINIYKIVEVSCHGNPEDLYEINKYISVGVVESDNDLNIDFLNSLDLSDRTIFNM